MAIYHLSVKPVSRGGGRSATAAAAYRAAGRVHDRTTGQTFDYTRKRGVEHVEIVLPAAVAARDGHWARDREALWNEAERAEHRSNSRVAREYEIALPHELSQAQRLALVRGFAAEIADRHGVAVDCAVHAPHRAGDARNHHAHLLATTRVVEPGGLGGKATIEWSDANRRQARLAPARREIEAIRARWAQLVNERLFAHGIRVDHRSLAAQGVERVATAHLGPAVAGLARRGLETEVGKRLAREAFEAGQRRLERAAEIGRLEREERALAVSIVDVSGDIAAARRERDRERNRTSAQAAERRKDRTPSLEELQREGRERWREYRRTQEQGRASPGAPSQAPSGAPEREGPEQDRARGKGRDGPELE